MAFFYYLLYYWSMDSFNWEYALTHGEEWLCCEVGFERQKPFGGRPEKNRNYSEGDRFEVFQHIQCAEAELAAARLLGYSEFYPHYNTFKDVLDIPGFEVRYSRSTDKTNGHRLRYAKIDDSSVNTPYILMIGGPEVRTKRSREEGYPVEPYKAIGWIYSDQIKNSKYDNWPYSGFSVPAEDLRSMDELLAIRAHNLSL